MQQNAPTLKSCCKLLHWAGKAYLLIWRILFHLAGVVFVIPPGFCYVIAEFPIAYCCIWHGSCLGTLHSVAFSRVLREYPVGGRVNLVLSTVDYINLVLFTVNWCHAAQTNSCVFGTQRQGRESRRWEVTPHLLTLCFQPDEGHRWLSVGLMMAPLRYQGMLHKIYHPLFLFYFTGNLSVSQQCIWVSFGSSIC